MQQLHHRRRTRALSALLPIGLCVAVLLGGHALPLQAEIPVAHVYHNHMPNFWPFYAVDVTAAYEATPVGEPIRYTYDARVIALKKNPPAGYRYFLPAGAGGGIMPHDALDSDTYYGHHAKVGAYQFWPHQVAREFSDFSSRRGQIHVTMSGAVVNNVNDCWPWTPASAITTRTRTTT